VRDASAPNGPRRRVLEYYGRCGWARRFKVSLGADARLAVVRAAAGMQRDLLHRHHASSIVGLWPARASSPRAHEGFMLWKLTPEQLDRFLLVAAAILTVVFAIVALALAFLAF
jgi:hypothetical protein